MRLLHSTLPVLGILLFLTLPASSGEKKVDAIPFEVYAKGYFVKNNAGLPTNPAYLVLQSKKDFDLVFGIGVVMGQRPKFVEDKLFAKNVIATVIKSGNTLWTYEVKAVRADKKKLIVEYTAKGQQSATATYNSPLILSVPRGEFTEIVFVENGKEAGKQPMK